MKQGVSLFHKKTIGNVFGFLFVFGSRSDSNVCVRKAALKSARSGLGVLLRRGMEGRGRIAAIRKVDVSCPFPISCLANLVLKHRKPGTVSLQSPQATSIGNRCFEELELSSSKATAAVGRSVLGWEGAAPRCGTDGAGGHQEGLY